MTVCPVCQGDRNAKWKPETYAAMEAAGVYFGDLNPGGQRLLAGDNWTNITDQCESCAQNQALAYVAKIESAQRRGAGRG